MHKYRVILIQMILGLIMLSATAAEDRPNILWLSSEDNGPHLGCYGDAYADTPNLDKLAARGVRYTQAWSNAPVCAPARTTIISGLYPTSTGSQHMRSEVRLPDGMKMFPQYLREAGYYCTNNSKEDYNLEKPGMVWDESSPKAHWKNRPDGAPFFAVFNITLSHESQIRNRPHTLVHDPGGVRIPAYHPDLPEVRRDWAQYYDRLTEMDALMGELINELEAAGLAEDTIIMYWGDHGSGMPRNKRWTYDSGLLVPLIVHVPEKYKHLASSDYKVGGESDRLVGFIDFAPTVLSLIGLLAPEEFQGAAFMGKHEVPPSNYIYGFRDRMDERYDMTVPVRDSEYLYVRNYMPHRAQGQYLEYMFETPTTVAWKAAYEAGQLNPAQAFFWEPKPTEELYLVKVDPEQVNNLAGDPAHAVGLERMREAHRDWVYRVRDLSFLPESEIVHRSEGSAPYTMGQDEKIFPLEEIYPIAQAASRRDAEDIPLLMEALNHPDSVVRYWAAIGFLVRGDDIIKAHADLLEKYLDDPAATVRIVVAEALGKYGTEAQARRAVEVLLADADARKSSNFVCIQALGSLDELDEKAAWAIDQIRELPKVHASNPPRTAKYIERLLVKILADLDALQE